jgi:hypothetical protein
LLILPKEQSLLIILLWLNSEKNQKKKRHLNKSLKNIKIIIYFLSYFFLKFLK